MIYCCNGKSPAEPNPFFSATAGCLGQLRSPEGAAGALQEPAWQIESEIKVLFCSCSFFFCAVTRVFSGRLAFSPVHSPFPVKAGCEKPAFLRVAASCGEMAGVLLRFRSRSFKKLSGSPLVQEGL